MTAVERTGVAGWRIHVEQQMRDLVPGYQPYDLPGLPADDPPPQRAPWFAHMALPTWENLLARKAWADGPALYGKDGVDFDYDRLEPFQRSPAVPIYAMPKTMSDPSIDGIRAALTYDQLAALYITKGQEPEDDPDKQTLEAQAAYRAETVRYINGFAGTPAKVGSHLQAWTTSPNNPSRSPDLLRAFLPRADEGPVSAFVGCSLYIKSLKFVGRLLLEAFIEAVRDTPGYGGVPIMMSACGVSVPASGATQAVRDIRAEITTDLFDVAAELLPGQPVGWFDAKWPTGDSPVYDYVVADDPALAAVMIDRHAMR